MEQMFTGLVQAVGRVASLTGSRLEVDADGAWPNDPLQTGESIAVNGACLTALDEAARLKFDLSPETLSRTALGALQPGSLVNLERSLRVGDRLGGHFVLGHVDAVAQILAITPQEGFFDVEFSIPDGAAPLLIDKGSVALDGISLTVIAPSHTSFRVAVIPHTWQHTHLHTKQAGNRVNLELDMLAKHVQRLSQA